MNILGKRYFFFGLSLLIIVSGLVILFLKGGVAGAIARLFPAGRRS